MAKIYDIAIIGSGPAGMAAAIEASKHAGKVAVLDEQPAPGGQIYRNVQHATDRQNQILGKDYRAGKSLTDDFIKCDATRYESVTVWQVSNKGAITFSRNGTVEQIKARRIIVANGATERPVPVPGWTLPGVMTAGAAQILMKAGGLVAQSAVLVGSGPLLYLVAAQLVDAGAPPKALVETQTKSDLIAAFRHWKGMVTGWRYLAKGMGLMRKLRRAGVKRYQGASAIRIVGRDQADAVCFTSGRRIHRIETETVLLHLGVVPNTQITRSLRLDHVYSSQQSCFVPSTDPFGRSSSELVFVAGDGAGIGGAVAAELSGQLATLGALHDLHLISCETLESRTHPLLRARERELAIRPFLDRAFAPPADILRPDNDTIICRCEEVTAGDIRRFAKLGCTGPNQAKAFGRSGMGPCQGRYCGQTVTEILAAENNQSQDETGAYRIRAPIKPVSLGELAAFDKGD